MQPNKSGSKPNIAAIKKALADKQKAKETAEKEAKLLQEKLMKQKESTKIEEKTPEPQIIKEVVTKKLARFSFLRKDVQTQTKTEIKQEVITEKESENNETFKSPITCILGHVDTGKTKLLDKLRHTNVQLGEAGGITQQIGATFFPKSYLKDACFVDTIFPGILIIDTPGHESFTNLRSRGSSVCNIAILVIDIMHSLEPQTIESIEMLRMRKTPFVIALNKIDRIYRWKNVTDKELYNFDINRQSNDAQTLFYQRLEEITLALNEKGLNIALFDNNHDQSKFVNVVPTSAITGEGIPDLFSTLIKLCEKFMKKKLTYSEDFECTVLEVKNEEGFGTTLDVILSNGVLNEGEKICLCGFEGPIVTTIKTLLVPEPCKETRAKPSFIPVKKVRASLGIKIAGLGLEKVICGTNIIKISKKSGVGLMTEEKAKQHVMEELNSVMKSIEIKEVGVHVQASTLGSLEALLNFLKDKVPVSSISIGNVRKKDILKASIMTERKKEYAVMLCFDIKIEKEMEEIAKEKHVKIFSAPIIYHLLDQFDNYLKDVTQKKKDENKPVFPCKLKIIPNNVFTTRSPIVMGVEVQGTLTTDAKLVREDGFVLGTVTSIENNKKKVKKAITNDKVAIKVETEETPRMLGRHFEETDIFYSFMTRSDIDVLKELYREEIGEE